MKEAVNNHPHHSTEKAVKREKKNQAKEWTTKETGILEIPQPNHSTFVSIYIVV